MLEIFYLAQKQVPVGFRLTPDHFVDLACCQEQKRFQRDANDERHNPKRPVQFIEDRIDPDTLCEVGVDQTVENVGKKSKHR